MELEVFMDLRDEPFLSFQGYWHCHCSPCQMQVPKHDSGKFPPVPGVLRCHLRAVFSALGVLLQACSDSDLNFKLQREGDSCPWDMCFVTSATSAVPSALGLLGTVREIMQ